MADVVDLDSDWDDDAPRRRTYERHVDAFEKYDESKFRRRFRLGKNAVNDLVNLLETDLERKSRRYCTISPQTQILTALRYYGGGAFQTLTGDSIGISQPAASKVITAVSTALCDRLADFVKFPVGNEIGRVKRSFYDVAGFRDVIACIDCTHIRITRPHVHEEQYVNRKSYHSLNVQASCDENCKFSNVFVKWPGGTHDSFILRDSSVWTKFQEDPTIGVVLGDSGYPCRYWLLPPFESPTTDAQRLFNTAHRKTRVRIEQAFGQLKRRFNCLHQENRRALRNATLDIGACFVLHNFAKLINDPDDFDPLDDDDDAGDLHPPANDRALATGVQRRQSIANRFLNANNL